MNEAPIGASATAGLSEKDNTEQSDIKKPPIISPSRGSAKRKLVPVSAVPGRTAGHGQHGDDMEISTVDEPAPAYEGGNYGQYFSRKRALGRM